MRNRSSDEYDTDNSRKLRPARPKRTTPANAYPETNRLRMTRMPIKSVQARVSVLDTMLIDGFSWQYFMIFSSDRTMFVAFSDCITVIKNATKSKSSSKSIEER